LNKYTCHLHYNHDKFFKTEGAQAMIKLLKYIGFLCWMSICYAEEDRTEVRKTLLEDVNQAWQTSPSVQQISLEEKTQISPSSSSIETQLKTIIIPKICINGLTLGQALGVLTEIVRVYNFSEQGLNFVLIDPDQKAGNVNLDVNHISLWKIIQYLQEQTNFCVAFEDNIVVFRDKNKDSEALITKAFPIARGHVLQILNYCQNSDKKQNEETLLKTFFQKLGIPFEDKRTGFVYDGQNIVITHQPDFLKKIEDIVELYRNSQQISIETKFLEVQQGILEEIGIKWNSGSENNVKLNTDSSLRNLSTLHNLNKPSQDSSIKLPQFPNALNFGTNTANFLDAHTILNRYQMNVLLRAIEQHSDADLMSAPKVTVLSGRKAEIVVAQELRYPESYRDGHAEVGSGTRTSSAGTALIAGVPEKFVTRNVGVEMSVTPVIESDKKIHLRLKPCVTEFEGFVEYGGQNIVTNGDHTTPYSSGYIQPIFSTRKIKTEVSLSDGSTLVMGGLTREEVKETHDKIPFFSQIPLLGKLFTSKGQTSQKKNLLIFVTANLVDEYGKYGTSQEIPTSQTV